MNRTERVRGRLNDFRSLVRGHRRLTNSEDTATVLSLLNEFVEIVEELVAPPDDDELLEEFADHAEGTD